MAADQAHAKLLAVAMIGQKDLSRVGGVEVVVKELAFRMATMGYAVTCYNRKSTNEIEESSLKPTCENLSVKYMPTIRCKGLAAVSSSIFAALHASLCKYDVIHFHAEGPSFMCWLPKLFRKRVIVTIHGLDWQRAKWGKLASFYIMQGEKNAVKYADEVIVLSREVQRYFKDRYDRDTKYIPNGVSRPHICEVNLIAKQFGLEKDKYILFLGRLVPEKGLLYLIEAYKKVQTEKRLVIAGAASDTNNFVHKIREAAKEDNRILFVGFVDGELLEELYSNAYIYCLPSDLEGMPIGLLEAMSYGNCCLVSDIPECTEIVKDKAIWFKKGNISDLQDKIQMLVDTPKFVAEYRVGIADYVCETYNWDEVVRQTVNLYTG